MQTIELEKTYLAKHIPENLNLLEYKELIDIYIPVDMKHPKLRVRMKGDSYELTKKVPINENDASKQIEQTIQLDKYEYECLSKINGKRIHKIRYCYEYKGKTAEVDVFQGDLKGLVTVDFEFENTEEYNAFEIPDFCLVDITQEDFIAGGMLCGRKYYEIQNYLEKYDYIKLST